MITRHQFFDASTEAMISCFPHACLLEFALNLPKQTTNVTTPLSAHPQYSPRVRVELIASIPRSSWADHPSWTLLVDASLPVIQSAASQRWLGTLWLPTGISAELVQHCYIRLTVTP